MPVEYSDVITRAPSTMMISWPSSNPNRLTFTAFALTSAVTCAMCCARSPGGIGCPNLV